MISFPAEKAAEVKVDILKERRKKLLARMKGRPFLIPAGEPKSRNYAANGYRFRASSHFLWLTGWQIPGAFVASDGRGLTLFMEEQTTADIVWHGPLPSLQDHAHFLGLDVRPLKQLPDWLKTVGAERAQALPASDIRSSQKLSGFLKREIRPDLMGPIDERDIPLARAMVELRLIHDDMVLSSMRRACEVTHRAHVAGMKVSRPGVPEREIAGAMIGEMARAGMDPAYLPIVSTHGEVLHNEGFDFVAQGGDLLLADVGAESLGGVASDVTRTWPVSGKFSATQKPIYELVLKSQLKAIEAVKPGVRYREVHLTSCRTLLQGLVELGILRGDPAELLSDGAQALFFPHGIGHLLGLDVHDMEDLGDLAGYEDGRFRSQQFGLNYLRMDRDLRAGMAVTIEPGFYQIPALLDSNSELCKKIGDRLNRVELAKFKDVRGIRIEDDVLVTDLGCEVLTRPIPKTVAEVEAVVGK
jgi:Xaa-Pro aminopeptidase